MVRFDVIISTSHPPTFPVSYDHVTLREDDLEDDEVLYYAKATDLDEALCKDPEGCSCSIVTYQIEGTEHMSIFSIGKDTGEITVTAGSEELLPAYEVTISASNNGGAKSTMILSVTVDGQGKDRYLMPQGDGGLDSGFSDIRGGEGVEPLERHKRSTLPSEITFALTKTGRNAAETTMKVGTKYDFQLLITMPATSQTLKVR
ncbi:hypothetical protein ElyMa_003852300 [Elysia marginata]|uniref:Cadherin domain-containing protein n=1 Tax=Elysia marginata TaxID=1093978 RepID=A0AAV4FHZ6_9GAST|nr:hypothetical protein ElyMa_003852300 [Elysia marginata]